MRKLSEGQLRDMVRQFVSNDIMPQGKGQRRLNEGSLHSALETLNSALAEVFYAMQAQGKSIEEIAATLMDEVSGFIDQERIEQMHLNGEFDDGDPDSAETSGSPYRYGRSGTIADND